MLVHVQSLKLTRITHKNWVSALFYSPVCNTSNPNYWHLVCAGFFFTCIVFVLTSVEVPFCSF